MDNCRYLHARDQEYIREEKKLLLTFLRLFNSHIFF